MRFQSSQVHGTGCVWILLPQTWHTSNGASPTHIVKSRPQRRANATSSRTGRPCRNAARFAAEGRPGGLTVNFDQVWLILGPAVTALVGVAVWLFQSRIETIRRESERLHSDRRKIYTEVLELYIRLLSGTKNPADTVLGLQQAGTFDHRKAIFELTMMGADDVVTSFNNFVEYSFSARTPQARLDSKHLLTLWARVLLAIRRDLGFRRTKLKEADMLRGQIMDVDQYIES